MNKGLDALIMLTTGIITEEQAKEYRHIIEEELKVNEIAIDFINRVADLFKKHDLEELEDKIIKTYKALDIIKNKKVDVWTLGICNSLKNYHYVISAKHYPELKLTNEEYDLLKEVLL